jgi:ATP-binding cassette subfamily B protein
MAKRIPNKPIPFFFYISKPHKIWAVVAVVAVLIASVLSDYLVIVLKNLTDSITSAHIESAEVWKLAIAYPALYFLSQIIWRISGFSGMRWFTGAHATGFNSLYNYTARHSKAYFQDHFAGSLVTNVSNAVENSDGFFQRILWVFLPQLFTLIVFIYFTASNDWRLGLIIGVWTIVFISVNYSFVRWLQPAAIRANELRSVIKGKMVDSFSNISLVHEHAYLMRESAYIAKTVNEHRLAGLKNWSLGEWILVLNSVLIAVFIGGMIWTSVYLLERGIITVGVVVMVIAIVTDIASSLFFIGGEMIEASKEYSGITEGLNEVVKKHQIEDAPAAEKLLVSAGAIDFENVSFKYGTSCVFDNLSISIKPGEKVGLVGRSGAGKSTFVSLLLRHYDVNRGSIKVDGQDISQVKLESLRRNIAYVPQDTSLFHRSIRENIQYGSRDAQIEDIERFADLARAHSFIVKLKDGYDTIVGERGVRLSGGQRQRIALARAFMKDAPILILDEATSSLDSESEREIQKALSQLMKGRTVIAIAHRLSTLKEMDRILLIEDGHIIEDGAPSVLLKKEGGAFKSLWEHQVSGFIVDEDMHKSEADAENLR